MFDRLRDLVLEPGPVKSPFMALFGYFTWSAAKGILEGVVLIGTAVIVVSHAITVLVRRWCPKRRNSNCGSCHLKGSIFCCYGLNKDEV